MSAATEPTDPFHDFSVPQDADLVSSSTPNGEDESSDDDSPLGESDD
jgi:hypothetical protein